MSHVRRLSRRLDGLINFERPRDDMGQFSDTSDTNPDKMRKAYVQPLRERLNRPQPKAAPTEFKAGSSADAQRYKAALATGRDPSRYRR
jgi:hypothetical protein